MYLHIGNEIEVLASKIIGIFDIKVSKDLLQNEKYKVRNITDEEPASLVIIQKNDEIIIYVSSISSITLYKRLDEI